MGLSSSKTKSETDATTTENATTTPQAPSWLSDAFTDYTGRIGSFLDADPNSFVAGASPLQQQAWGNADRLGLWTGNSNAASNIAMNAANAPGASVGSASLLDNLDSYFSPYKQRVVDTTLAGYDQNTEQQRARMAGQAAKAGAFGGSRYGIAQGQFESDQARNRAAAEAGLLDQGFNTAAGLSQSDAANRQQASLFNAQNYEQGLQRQLQAAGQLNQYGNDFGANTRADLGAMAELGGQQRGIEQGYALSPLAQLQAGGSLFGATPWQAFTGQQIVSNGTQQGTTTQTQSPSLFNSLLGAASLIPFSGGFKI